SGCRFSAPVTDPLPGVRVLRSEFEAAGPTFIVLDTAGPALMRVDGGDWHHHGDSPDAQGPRWSAQKLTLAAGRHQLEIRLGTYGGNVDLGLLLVKAAPPDEFEPRHLSGRYLPEEALFDLAMALSAHAAGETDRELEHAAALTDHHQFALGLAAAARMAEFDPTRPEEMDRDRARSLTLKAVAADSHLARAWLDLSRLELNADRPREATEHARRARSVAPNWWPAALQMADALRGRGLESDADVALSDALFLGQKGEGACSVLERALHRAEERAVAAEEKRLVGLVLRCDAQSDSPSVWYRQRGDAAASEAALRRALPTSLEPSRVLSDLAALLLERGDAAGAASELQALVDGSPRDSQLRLRLADAMLASGNRQKSLAVLAEALRLSPGNGALRQAARLTGLPLPLDEFRLDGGQVIRDYLASGHRYQAPAVVVLDRAVERIFPDGARANLTHTITLVLSKEGIERAGEVEVPSGAEILALRTRKPDGTIREAQEIAGKPSISASDLAVGDFVEWETLEFRQPAEAFAPGFLGERFYFQSFEAPLDRSEYLLVVPSDMSVDLDRRAGAPQPVVGPGGNGTRILRMVAQQMPQLFAERSSVIHEDWVPSIRASSGVDLARWSRFLADRLFIVGRASPELRRVAAQIKRQAGGVAAKIPEAIVGWVNQHVEPDASLFEPATSALARGQGNRAALVTALARTLGLRAEWMFARPLSHSPVEAPIVRQELDDFSEVLVRFRDPDGTVRFFDPRLRRAPFGYLPPGL
ncbi:MAG TPA: tetratricopeptide repeat protein, partial [Polyangia bacterium]